VIIKSPAIYGKSAPRNFSLVKKAVAKNIPVPFASISNKRSLIYFHKVDLIPRCLSHLSAAGQILLASDRQNLSTPEIMCLIGALHGAKTKLLLFPYIMLKVIFKVIGNESISHGLLGDRQVDTSKILDTLQWQSPFNPRQMLGI